MVRTIEGERVGQEAARSNNSVSERAWQWEAARGRYLHLLRLSTCAGTAAAVAGDLSKYGFTTDRELVHVAISIRVDDLPMSGRDQILCDG